MIIAEVGQRFEEYDPKNNIVLVHEITEVDYDSVGNLDGCHSSIVDQYELNIEERSCASREQRENSGTYQ